MVEDALGEGPVLEKGSSRRPELSDVWADLAAVYPPVTYPTACRPLSAPCTLPLKPVVAGSVRMERVRALAPSPEHAHLLDEVSSLLDGTHRAWASALKGGQPPPRCGMERPELPKGDALTLPAILARQKGCRIRAAEPPAARVAELRDGHIADLLAWGVVERAVEQTCAPRSGAFLVPKSSGTQSRFIVDCRAVNRRVNYCAVTGHGRFTLLRPLLHVLVGVAYAHPAPVLATEIDLTSFFF